MGSYQDLVNKYISSISLRQPHVGYGQRVDGTEKGIGYFGELPNRNGGISTELSFSFGDQRGEHLAPLIVPTLSMGELYSVLGGGRLYQGEPIDNAYRKAMDYARYRESLGMSPFAQHGEWR